ncbi:MAG: hypothetical protein ACTHNW_13605 [Mucilaginibacter sp.]
MYDFELQPPILPDKKTDLDKYFNNLFTDGTPAFQKLAYELQREFRFGGSPDVNHIHIDRTRFDADKGTGSFRVVLDIDFTFGCEDVRTNKPDQTSEWTFALDAINHKLLFYGSPYAHERSTADEF